MNKSADANSSAGASPEAAAWPRPTGWRRWLPSSLFGRLMAVLVLGLVAAQGLSFWINLAERDRLMVRAAGVLPAQRVADLVLLLDPLEPPERERILRVMSAPPLRVRLLPAPEALPPVPEGREPPAHALAHLALYRSALRSALADDRPFQVDIRRPRPPLPEAAGFRAPPPPVPESQEPPAAEGSPGLRPGLAGRSLEEERRLAREWRNERRAEARLEGRGDWRGDGRALDGIVFVAQVRLQDGVWLRMDTRLPPAEASLPFRLLSSLSILLVAVLGLSWWAVRRVTQPLRDLSEAAEALGHDLHRPPLPDDGPNEVRSAHRAFNTMQARLARYIEDRTRMLAAMSHDLKTPLTRMRLRAELLDDDALRERFQHDLDEMSQMVSDTLEFMRGSETPVERRPVDVLALLESLQADQEAMGRDVVLTGQCHRPWLGDAHRLRRCVGNLVDNAVLYGQRAEIELEAGPQALTIRVRDAGPGIPEADLERVFEPFVRLEASRNRDTGGTGLGLAIARNIARQAGGELSLRNHPQGGLEASLQLPW